MPADSPYGFRSVLSACMEKFLQEKHACGYAYRESIRILRHLDNFLVQEGLATCELPSSIARKWLAKKAHESAQTQRHRIILVRQFSRFLLRLGYSAYVPDSTFATRSSATFLPRMLTDEELRKFFQAVDALKPTARSSLRHLIMPEVFRLLFGCGFRVGDAIFFPGPSGRPFNLSTIYKLFRQLLLQCGIPHGGRGKGPRIHDARHLFAVRVLRRWYQDGEDLDAKLPLLATYLGHLNLSGTQHYLHLTSELFPEITARADAVFGDVIPRRIEP